MARAFALYVMLLLNVGGVFHVSLFYMRQTSWIFEIGFRVGFSSKDVESVFSRSLLAIQLQRIDQFVHKPSRRFPVQCSQQKNSCSGGVSFLPFYSAISLYKA